MENIADLPTHEPAPARRRPWYHWRRLGFNFLTVSILAHVVFGFLAAYFIVQRVQATRKLTFKSGPAGPSAPSRSLEHKVQMKKQKSVQSAPPQARRVVTSGISKVALPDLPAMPSMTAALSPASISGMGAAGLAPGGMGGGMGGMGGNGGAAINFFGVRSSAKRFAFLLDYSGSMSGPFRIGMEKKLVESLSTLPIGTQVLIIPWAGPAWLYNQTITQVNARWMKIDTYDNFALKPGGTLDNPTWISVNPDSIQDIAQRMHAQVQAPGGTDWRQPFRLAMQAKPAPDVIFFMTDGQIPAETTNRGLAGIDAALKAASQPPKVNCLWIENKANKPDALRRLASTYHGEFLSVK